MSERQLTDQVEPPAPTAAPHSQAIATAHPSALSSRDAGTRAQAALSLQRSVGNATFTRLASSGPHVLARTQAETLKKMQETAGYKALDEATRKRLDALIGGGTSLAAHGWGKMETLLADATKDKTSAATFKSFLSGKTWLNFDVRLPGEKRLTAKKYKCDGPVDAPKHKYRSGEADAKKWTVTVEDTWRDGTPANMSISVFEPKTFAPPKPGRVLPKVADLAKVLAELPTQSRSQIKQVDLHPVPNPDDAIWQADPNYNPSGAEFVSHMTAGSDGVVDIFPASANANLVELETTFIHETGHVASNTAWGDDTTKATWDAWRKARTDDGISLSTYADSSDAEDAAESWMLFTSALGTPLEAEVRALIPNRVKLMETLLKHNGPPTSVSAAAASIAAAVAAAAAEAAAAAAAGSAAGAAAAAAGATAGAAAAAAGAKAGKSK